MTRDTVQGPPCGDCLHAVVCRIKAEHEARGELATAIAILELPAGLHISAVVDCDFFLPVATYSLRVELPPEGSPEPVDWSSQVHAALEAVEVAQAKDSIPTIEADWTTSTPAVAIASPEPAEEATPAAPPPATRRSVRPIGESTIVCDPGCGNGIIQSAIGEHRRTCEAVLAFKAERGVTVVPDLLGSAAPLPAVPASDFEQRRNAAAKEAVERTWQRTHGVDEAPPADPLTLHQRRVLETVMRLGGDRKAAAAELGLIYQSIDVALAYAGKKGQLPVDLIPKLPARFAQYAAVPA